MSEKRVATDYFTCQVIISRRRMGMDCFTNQVLMTEREKKYRKFI